MTNDDPQLLTGGDDDDGTPSATTPGTAPDRGFSFTISNGTVSAIQAVDGSHSFNLRIPSDATFALGAGTVTETLAGTHATTVITYTAEAGDPSVYQISSQAETIASPSVTDANGDTHGFNFTVTNGAVTAEQVTFSDGSHSHSFSVPISADTEFTVGSGTITETEVHGDAVETLTYVQPSGQTLYALASAQTTIIAQGSAATALDVEPGERDEFTFGSGGTVTAVERVHADGSTSAITLGSHESFTQLAPGLVERIDTFGSHSDYEVFATGPGADGVYTAVAHGEGSTVDLAGLQTQLAQLPTFFTNLI